jgi:hypothetical protein
VLRSTRPRFARISTKNIERFLATVRRFAPSFDTEAARQTLAASDTLYTFALPLPLGDFQKVRGAMQRAFRKNALPAACGISVGSTREPFVVYRNFVAVDAPERRLHA